MPDIIRKPFRIEMESYRYNRLLLENRPFKLCKSCQIYIAEDPITRHFSMPEKI